MTHWPHLGSPSNLRAHVCPCSPCETQVGPTDHCLRGSFCNYLTLQVFCAVWDQVDITRDVLHGFKVDYFMDLFADIGSLKSFHTHSIKIICTTCWWDLNKIVGGVGEKVYFRSQILERPSIGEYWNISGVPVLAENVICTFFRTCWCYSEDYNTDMQNFLVLSNTRVPVSGTFNILFPPGFLKTIFDKALAPFWKICLFLIERIKRW